MEKRLLLEQDRFKASVLPKEKELVGQAWLWLRLHLHLRSELRFASSTDIFPYFSNIF